MKDRKRCGANIFTSEISGLPMFMVDDFLINLFPCLLGEGVRVGGSAAFFSLMCRVGVKCILIFRVFKDYGILKNVTKCISADTG